MNKKITKGWPYVYIIAVVIESDFIITILKEKIAEKKELQEIFGVLEADGGTHLTFRLRLQLTALQATKEGMISDMIRNRVKKIIPEYLGVPSQSLNLKKNLQYRFERVVLPETRLPYKKDEEAS